MQVTSRLTGIGAGFATASMAAPTCISATGGWAALLATAVARASQPGGAASASLSRAAAQQQRSYARYLQFPQRGGGGWGGGGGGWGRLDDGDKVVWALVGANVAVFLAWRAASPVAMSRHFTVSLESVRSGRMWTPLTAAFSHADGYHLFANMLGLFFFGRDIGRLFGGKRLLLLYAAGGLAGSLAHVAWYWWRAREAGRTRWGDRSLYAAYAPPALGASAAVSAIMAVDILLFPTRTILLYGILPLPAALFGALWLYQDISGAIDGRGHIAHVGHLGGAATGLAFFLAFKRGRIRPKGWY